MGSVYDIGLGKNAANYAALTPLVFLDWCHDVYPDRTAVVHGSRRYTWRETTQRARQLANALEHAGIGTGDTVAVMAANTPEMYEAHFGVPMTGAVLNTLNTRLDPGTVAFGLEHAEAKAVIVDREFSPTMRAALEKTQTKPLVIDIDDPEFTGDGEQLGATDYEAFIQGQSTEYARAQPSDEWQAISLNYTSGTTGNPKGVVYHHRGAYLNGVGNILTWGMPRHSVYLWTLPMFHCNGWCFPWTMAANAGTNICLRQVRADKIYQAFHEEKVTHYCGAPVVHNLILDNRQDLDHQINAMVAGAPPPAAMIEGMAEIGIDLTHAYGLTETYGPATFAAPQDGEWGAKERGRQGVRYLLEDAMTVVDENNHEVPNDDETVGEIVFRGNIVMKGYLKNEEATEEAFRDGWFHSGDLAVKQEDGYVKIKDRAKDVIISGGENISSVEVEDVLYRHPAVMFAGVVAKPDKKWGETPIAYVELKPGQHVTEEELKEHCRQGLAKFKVPKEIIFAEIPRTSTGKIQKNVLREQTNSAGAID